MTTNATLLFAHLRDTRNGKTVRHEHRHITHTSETAADVLYIWEDGNYSCDCNRSLFMYGSDGALNCNINENVIVIDKIENEAGEILAQNL